MMETKPARINTERLCLHAIAENDADDVIALLRNGEVGKTYILPDFKSHEEERKLFEGLKRLSDSKEHFVYGIYLGNRLIGFINDVEINDTEIELGLVIHPRQKCNGFATEVLSEAISVLFDMGYAVVKTGVFEENTASIRVMEKSGMVRLTQDSEIEYRGQVHRCVWFEKRKT